MKTDPEKLQQARDQIKRFNSQLSPESFEDPTFKACRRVIQAAALAKENASPGTSDSMSDQVEGKRGS